MDPNKPRKIIRFDELTPAGRAVWVAGAAFHLGTRVVQTSLRHLGRVAAAARRAYIEGRSEPPSGGPRNPRRPAR